jgi:hypothetical protein
VNSTCFFCSDPACYGYESDSHHLWLCQSHWRLIGETLIDEFEEEGLIDPVQFLDD